MLGISTNLHAFQGSLFFGVRHCTDILLPHMRLFRGALGPDFLFRDDNVPLNCTEAVEEILESEDIQCIYWPARSPKLNLIENMWDLLSIRLAFCDHAPITIQELELALQEELDSMPQQLLDKYFST